jgi:putative flippase GtrA
MDALVPPPSLRVMPPAPPLVARFATFARSLVTGGAATIADLAVIAFATAVLHLDPRAANVPALLAGAVVQFFGNRHFAFRASTGKVHRQALLFAGSELVTMALNALLYQAVATRWTLTPASAVLARAITTNLVFLLWSYPVWRRVFAAEKAPATG